MRRLILLVLLIVGALGVAPAAPAHPARAAVVHEAMPGGCHGDGQAAAHLCLGCAVVPDEVAAIAGRAASAAMPASPVPAPLAGRSLGFDPPPPRRAA